MGNAAGENKLMCFIFNFMEVILLCFPYYLFISLLLKAVHAKNADFTLSLSNLYVVVMFLLVYYKLCFFIILVSCYSCNLCFILQAWQDQVICCWSRNFQWCYCGTVSSIFNKDQDASGFKRCCAEECIFGFQKYSEDWWYIWSL